MISEDDAVSSVMMHYSHHVNMKVDEERHEHKLDEWFSNTSGVESKGGEVVVACHCNIHNPHSPFNVANRNKSCLSKC